MRKLLKPFFVTKVLMAKERLTEVKSQINSCLEAMDYLTPKDEDAPKGYYYGKYKELKAQERKLKTFITRWSL